MEQMHHPEVYLKVICLLSPGSKLDATTVMLILIKFRSQQPRLKEIFHKKFFNSDMDPLKFKFKWVLELSRLKKEAKSIIKMHTIPYICVISQWKSQNCELI